ncbi:hypothetical protein P171DRAFT_195518 [Karstenula rhodostoma CBS 690.94]|uniref:Uncharacterized protein n=1 Tax=Karstenula rhodostoma CBS 690.94 TaxID=1392251 RepID=A0A9P4PVJ1_9PLEO|nr:hypothetical protein P171DRAFT_195518 [Karstenula rhodostoma CBS 690.94]
MYGVHLRIRRLSLRMRKNAAARYVQPRLSLLQYHNFTSIKSTRHDPARAPSQSTSVNVAIHVIQPPSAQSADEPLPTKSAASVFDSMPSGSSDIIAIALGHLT